MLIGALAMALLSSHAMAEADADEETAPAPSVAELAWMTGTWAGLAGPGELEENWTVPKAGSIQALVRMTGDGKTSMVEMIVIEEVEGVDGEGNSLTLRLQQWGPGFKPLTPEPTVLKLAELGENTVAFKAEPGSGAQFATLRYSRDGDNFTIGIETPEGAKMDIPLKAVAR